MSEYVQFSEELLCNFYNPATCSYMVPLSGKAAHDMGVLRDENATLKVESAKLRVENARLRKLLDDGPGRSNDGLAERGTCRNVSNTPSGFLCSECWWGDFDEPSHLLTTAKFTNNDGGPNYCPNCGRRISNPTYDEFMNGGRK